MAALTKYLRNNVECPGRTETQDFGANLVLIFGPGLLPIFEFTKPHGGIVPDFTAALRRRECLVATQT